MLPNILAAPTLSATTLLGHSAAAATPVTPETAPFAMTSTSAVQGSILAPRLPTTPVTFPRLVPTLRVPSLAPATLGGPEPALSAPTLMSAPRTRTAAT